MERFLLAVEPFSRTVLEALINNAVQGLVLCLAAALVLAASRGRLNAATRIAVWRVAFGGVLVLLLADLGRTLDLGPVSPWPAAPHAVSSGLRAPAPSRPSTGAPAIPEIREAEPVARAAAPATAERAGSALLPLRLPIPSPWPALALLAVAVVAGFGLLRLGVSYACLLRLKARSWPLTGHEEQLQRLQKAVGLRRPVRLCASSEIATPILAGLKDPVILLPDGMADRLTGDELDYVILHELMHLRRRDDWSHTLQLLAEAVFFFHPAIRWIGRQLRLEQEMRCDDWVIALTGRTRPYAACLTKLARLGARSSGRLALATGTVLRKHEITRRIEAMLTKTPDSNPRLSRIGFAAVVWGPLLLMLVLATTTPLASLPGVASLEEKAPAVAAAPGAAPSRAVAARPVEQPARPAAPAAAESAKIEEGLRTVLDLPTESARVSYLLELGPQGLGRDELRKDYLRAIGTIQDDRNLDRLLSGLLEGKAWLSRTARQTLLQAARAGFDSESALADFMARKAQYFTGEEALRNEYRRIAEEMQSEEARALLSPREAQEGRWVRRTPAHGGAAEWVYENGDEAESADDAPEATATEPGERRSERRMATDAESAAPRRPERRAGDVATEVRALQSADPQERAAAAFALSQMRQGAAAAIPHLIALLRDETPTARSAGITSQQWGAGFESKTHTSPAEEAAKALIYIGKPSEQALAQSINSGQADSEKARWALGLVSQFD